MDDLRIFTNTRAIQTEHPLYDNFGEALSKEDARKFLHLNPNQPLILFLDLLENTRD